MTFTIFPPKLFSDWREATICIMLALFPCWLTVKLNQFIACMLYATNSAQHGWAIAYSTRHPISFPRASYCEGGLILNKAGGSVSAFEWRSLSPEKVGRLGFSFVLGEVVWVSLGAFIHLNVVPECWIGITFTAKSVTFDVNYLIQIQLSCHAPVAHKLFSHKQMKDYFRGKPLTSGDMSQITESWRGGGGEISIQG